MPFQVSPGVNTSEIDLTGVIPAVATSPAGFVGTSQWGPVNEIVTLGSEKELVNIFGKPNDDTATSFFSAANFLSYSNNLKFVRVVDEDTVVNAATGTALLVTNRAGYDNATLTSAGNWVAKYPGLMGNSLKVEMCDSKALYQTFDDSDVTGDVIAVAAHGFVNGDEVVFDEGSAAIANLVDTTTYYVIVLTAGTFSVATTYALATATSPTAVTLTAGAATGHAFTTTRLDELFKVWAYKNQFDAEPGTSVYASTRAGVTDEMHVVVIDEDGLITGVPGEVLERYAYVSKGGDARTDVGTSNYYATVINDGSNYIWFGNHDVVGTNWGDSVIGTTFVTLTAIDTLSLTGGTDGNTAAATTDERLLGLDLFSNAETVDIALLIAGEATATEVIYMVDSIAEVRKDCVVFFGPQLADVVGTTTSAAALTNVLEWRKFETNKNSSYAFMDSGWKYQYDKYNDQYRWVPLNGDIAGLCARTDDTNDPWFSPAGLNRGNIKNVVKLAWNPNKAQRDELYKQGINPVISIPGQGTVLYGDKTQLAKPSAFDRINVRRLFIVLEKAISTASKFILFEVNDTFTQQQFVNLVEPFLRDVKGRRGITDYRVVADSSNNTAEVIDRNEFVGDIFIKPSRSINFIQLNFVAVRTGVEFNEIVGKV